MSHGYKVGDRVISLYRPETFVKATVCCVNKIFLLVCMIAWDTAKKDMGIGSTSQI